MFACSPLGEKTVQWTVLREAREKRVPYGVPTRKGYFGILFLLLTAVSLDLKPWFVRHMTGNL